MIHVLKANDSFPLKKRYLGDREVNVLLIMILKFYNCLYISWWIKHFSEVKSTEWFLLVIRFRRWRASRAPQSYRISSPQNANFASSHHLILQSFGLHRIMTDLKKRGGGGSPTQLFYFYTFQKNKNWNMKKNKIQKF